MSAYKEKYAEFQDEKEYTHNEVSMAFQHESSRSGRD